MKDYLETVTKCNNLGNQVICWLHLMSMSGNTRFEEFLNYHIPIFNYVKKGYLQCCLEILSNTELCTQVFLAQQKAHQCKYAEKHRFVETGILKLQEFFEGCHNTNACSGKYKRVVEDKKKGKDEARAKKGAHCNNQGNHSGKMIIRIAMTSCTMIDIV